MVVALAAFLLSMQATMAVYDEQMAQVASQPGAAQLDAGMMTTMRWVTLGFAGVTSVAGPWLIGMLLSFVAVFFGQFQGGGVSLSAYLGMIGYARMPLVLSQLLGAVYMALTGQALNMSLAVFLPDGASPYLSGLLGMVNPFGLWYYALLGVGFAALFGRSPRRGWLLPAALFVLGTVANVLGSGMGAATVQMQ